MTKKLWGGFSDGRLDFMTVDTGFGGFGKDAFRQVPAIFTSRKSAREQYEDVRLVAIKEQRRTRTSQ